MTITQVAENLKVSEQAAYGLMQFLKEIGQVTITEADSNGKRGRRPKLYHIASLARVQLRELGVVQPATSSDPYTAEVLEALACA